MSDDQRQGDELDALLRQALAGDSEARESFYRRVYVELRSTAERHLRGQPGMQTLQATALVNEALAKILERTVHANDRLHFMRLASQIMRRILVDRARARSRRGTQSQVSIHQTGTDFLDAVVDRHEEHSADLLALDAELIALEALDPEAARIIEMTFFGGLETEECAKALSLSPRSIQRKLQVARAWLRNRLK
ncbi:MAG: ECF-type sigma factor [Vicinamibacterales bacterium]